MDFEQQLLLLKASPELHSHWYQKQYPDAAILGMSSAEHYLRFGGLLGRNPGKNFDTKYYLETYEDVAMSGMNPLLHYILFGKDEGRYKSAVDKQQKNSKKNKMELLTEDIQERIVKHLWGGLSIYALKSLADIYNNDSIKPDVRFLAAWHAARWYFFVDDHQKSIELANLISTLGDEYRSTKITTMIFAYSYIALNKMLEAQNILVEFLKSKPKDSDMRLALANTFSNDDQRLENINQVFLHHDLAPIERIDVSQPLSLANITAKATPINSNLKVSVIIPTYNSADKLGIAIESLLAQSWQNLEIIVVDDCSPDNTFEVAQEYSRKDARVIALRQKQNGGAYIARNTGIEYATGDFITTHDGDDWSHPHKIEKQMEYLQANPDVMGVCTYWIRAKHNLHFTQNWRLNSHLIHWSHSSFIFRRRVIEDIGCWDSVVVGGDTEFIWRVQAKYGNASVKNILPQVPMAIALDDEGSLTRTKATHVKTIHYGLRHIYRSCAQHWHKNSNSLRVEKEPLSRAFPAPLSMQVRNPPPLNVDILIAADFSVLHSCEKAFNLTHKLHDFGKKVALFHWPIFEISNSPLKATYFEIINRFEAQPLVLGQDILCEELLIADSRVLKYIPDQLPSVTTKAGSIFVDSLAAPQDNSLIENFKKIFNVSPKVVAELENIGISK